MDARDLIIIAFACYAVLSSPFVVLGAILFIELVGAIRENIEELANTRKDENSGSK